MIDHVAIFCEIDDFCKYLKLQTNTNLLSDGLQKRKRDHIMTVSEVMTISVLYHYSGYTTFKDYYEKGVMMHMRDDFPNLVSYNRFIELRKKIALPMMIFLVTKKLGNCTGISYADSFKLEACHIKRSSSHKTLKSVAAKGKTSMGWFYGLKVHIIINHFGEIISFYISAGNVADNNEHLIFKLTRRILGKLFGDKGYLLRNELWEKLYHNGLELITKIRSNMKNKLMKMNDKLLLLKRGVLESVGDILKEHLHMEHTRHRSVWGFFLHIFSSLTAYQFRDKKPSIAAKFPQILVAA